MFKSLNRVSSGQHLDFTFSFFITDSLELCNYDQQQKVVSLNPPGTEECSKAAALWRHLVRRRARAFVPGADFFADVGQVVQLGDVLGGGHDGAGFHRRHQLPQTRRRRLHQALARTNHTPVFLGPVPVLVPARLLPSLLGFQNVAERVLSFG